MLHFIKKIFIICSSKSFRERKKKKDKQDIIMLKDIKFG